MLVYLSLIDQDEKKAKFEIIYSEYKNLMFYVANQILGDTRDSEDIVHQAFLKVIEILEKIPVAACPQTRSLVVTIVERKAIDLYRVRKRGRLLPLDEENFHVAMPSQIDSFAEGSVIASAIAALPPRYRELLLLKYDNGYTVQEIAGIMDMSEANVKKTIQRAKAKLQTLLEEMGVEV
ncbi:MAG: sigma-70 family RNA polymerase sigma factor [Clostridia bacterium]|nr:sigma-70 family RNA polymerase sigma factor [Clostridia bacterium]